VPQVFTLRAAVAFPKGMCCIDLTEIESGSVYERVEACSRQMTFASEPAEDIREALLYKGRAPKRWPSFEMLMVRN